MPTSLSPRQSGSVLDNSSSAQGGSSIIVQGSSSSSNQNETRWQKPEAGRYKCNVDASFSQ
ncbi:hypothetical protein A2U01_0096043, partial [Trifolium medium]|nr:hypothetical protein [Trifolium medium]